MTTAIAGSAISEQDWRHAATMIRQSRGIVLITHRNPDGDGIGSQLALYDALAAAGLPVSMHNRDGVPRLYRFLAGAERVGAGEHCPALDVADLVISLDAGARSRLGMDDAFFAGRHLINIDHHASNTRFGDINLVDAAACSTGALAYALIRHMGLPSSSDAAMAVYVTLLTDTSSFRMSTVTPAVHRLAAELIEAGAEPATAARNIYASHRPQRVALLRRCLETLALRNGGRSAWLHVDEAMYADTASDVEDTEGLIDYGRAIDGVEVAVFVRPDEQDSWKASFRSKATADVGALAASLGGGGHRYASGCTLQGSLDAVMRRLQTEVDRLFP
jgi:bifunctional oligoribonuclease and PAP phosphatase NrnA